MAQAGGTNKVIVATTAISKNTIKSCHITNYCIKNYLFTAPAITATIEQGGSLYQAQFDYEQNKEWERNLKEQK